jgi:seryl-tRNA synthetase
MLDAKALRRDPHAIAQILAQRGHVFDADHYLALETQRRELQSQAEGLQQTRNERSKAIGQAKQQGQSVEALLSEVAELGDSLKAAEDALEAVQAELQTIHLALPNLPDDSVPAGKSEDDNVEIRRWGEPAVLGFTPRDHVELGEALGGLDFAAGAKLSGARKKPMCRIWSTIRP